MTQPARIVPGIMQQGSPLAEGGGLMPKGRARFKQWEIVRILKAVAKAKMCAKFDPDGSITVAPGLPGESNGDAVNPWDEVLDDAAEQKRSS